MILGTKGMVTKESRRIPTKIPKLIMDASISLHPYFIP
ncbi:MAG: hypothetical protein ACI94Y_003538 [Maribacter sp.]|jgi:hypothetical protein